jgi:hypothetical protein
MLAGFLTSCEKDEYEQIQYIRKTLGPFIVGESYEFAFSVASKDGSVLKDLEIEATYAGASGTMLDTKCYWTDSDGKDGNQEMLQTVSTNGNLTRASVIENYTEYEGGYTSYAVTVRYIYKVPEEARGNKVRFTVRYSSQNGSHLEYSTMEYEVGEVDMVRSVTLTDPAGHGGARYFSIADLRAYTLDEVNSLSKSASIDFVYRYNSDNITTPGGSSVKLNHAIISPAYGTYLDSGYMPAQWTKNNTWIEKRKWDDMQLRGAVPNNYVTDLDIRGSEMNGNTFAEYGLAGDFGLLVQTADASYRAYVYIKSVNNNNRSITLGIKRLKMN